MKSLFYLLLFTILTIISAQKKTKNEKNYIAAAHGIAGYYYDINGGGTCGAARGIKSFPMTKHIPKCEGVNSNRRRLNEYETNNIVAIPSRLFQRYKQFLCGKRIIVSVNGKERTDLNLVVWDGFNDQGDSGLRFSSTIFAELFGKNRCHQRPKISWRIVDDEIIRYNRALQGGAVCLVAPVDATPDIPFDDNVIVPDFFEGFPEDDNSTVKPIVPGLKYCVGTTTKNLPLESSFADNVTVPNFEPVTQDPQKDLKIVITLGKKA